VDSRVICGRYQVVERLGRGAMGVVYKAYDPVLRRYVAVKQMADTVVEDPQLRERFAQEARAAAGLNHPNIVTVYELEEGGSEVSIVMELLEGVDLGRLIARKTPIALEAHLNIMAQVCDGLDFAHRAGIIHRDIKPANLHVSPTGTLKILDFGIARLTSSKIATTRGVLGTPHYMSPEQVIDGPLDARSDLFAVGAVLYELLSGAKPFEADSVTAVLIKIVGDPQVPLRERAPHLPSALSALIDRALSKNPAERPQSAHEMRDALLSCAPAQRSPFAAETVLMLSRAVTAEIVRPPAPPPSANVLTRALTSNAAAPTTDTEIRLAKLALEQGRALRDSGDLAGAMRVCRSVLETVPGHTEALRELADLEEAIRRATNARGRPASLPEKQTTTASSATPYIATGLAAVGLIVLLVAGGLAGYHWVHRLDNPGLASTTNGPVVAATTNNAIQATHLPAMPIASAAPSGPAASPLAVADARPSSPPRPEVAKPAAPDRPSRTQSASSGTTTSPSMVADDRTSFPPRPGITQPAVSDQPSPTVTSREVTSLTIPEGEEVKLKLSNSLSSGDAKVGDIVELTVAEPLTIGGHIVIQQGAMAKGIVQTVTSQRFRRPGSLELRFDSVRAADGEEVSLRGVYSQKGRVRIRGEEVELDAGTPFTAQIAEGISIRVGAAARRPGAAR
jgi:tRNA A-37 threonylcarbamoyl transferase component Bud32